MLIFSLVRWSFDPQNLRFLGACEPPNGVWEFNSTDAVLGIESRNLSPCWQKSVQWFGLYASFSPLLAANRVCSKMGPKRGFLGSHAHSWGHMVTWPPKGTSLRENTSFELSTIKIGSAVRAVARSKNPAKNIKYKKYKIQNRHEMGFTLL